MFISLPRKNKDSVVFIKSENPKWKWEVYNYRGIFVGYLGRVSLKV